MKIINRKTKKIIAVIDENLIRLLDNQHYQMVISETSETEGNKDLQK